MNLLSIMTCAHCLWCTVERNNMFQFHLVSHSRNYIGIYWNVIVWRSPLSLSRCVGPNGYWRYLVALVFSRPMECIYNMKHYYSSGKPGALVFSRPRILVCYICVSVWSGYFQCNSTPVNYKQKWLGFFAGLIVWFVWKCHGRKWEWENKRNWT